MTDIRKPVSEGVPSPRSNFVVRFLNRYRKVFARRALIYWSRFWASREAGEIFAKKTTYGHFSTAIKELVFWLTLFCALVSYSLSASPWLMRLTHQTSNPKQGDHFVVIFTKWWIFMIPVALQILPMAAILWLIIRNRNIKYYQALMFYADQFSLFIASILSLLFLFFVLVEVPLGGMLLTGAKLDAIMTSPWIWCLVAPVIVVQVIVFYRMFCMIPQRTLGGWLQISYTKSFAYLLLAALGLAPYTVLFWYVFRWQYSISS